MAEDTEKAFGLHETWCRDPRDPGDYDGGLVELPNGVFIDPRRIEGITPLPESRNRYPHTTIESPARVRIDAFGQLAWALIELGDDAGAKMFAKWLQQIVNVATERKPLSE